MTMIHFCESKSFCLVSSGLRIISKTPTKIIDLESWNNKSRRKAIIVSIKFHFFEYTGNFRHEIGLEIIWEATFNEKTLEDYFIQIIIRKHLSFEFRFLCLKKKFQSRKFCYQSLIITEARLGLSFWKKFHDYCAQITCSHLINDNFV